MVKVFLREKKITKGRKSLYLDFYPPIKHPDTGKLTRREFLGLFIWDRPKTEPDKLHNRQTKALAEHIRAKRQIEIQNGIYGFNSETKKQVDFLEYFRKEADKRRSNDSNYGNWRSAYGHLHDFTKGALTVGEVTRSWIESFKNYLLGKLHQNTALSYFNKLTAAIKEANRDGLFFDDPLRQVDGIKPAETHREYLSIEELQKLAKTECNSAVLKRVALFSALTGLRFGDIQKLTWSEVMHSESEGFTIRFTQKKTKGTEYMPISEQAYQLLGPPGTGKVFPELKYGDCAGLKDWIRDAGITKHITFHCFRHTYATLQLMHGTDIYTVSKMLGHRELKTTQIYAKVVDKQKRTAADKIKLDL